ncbi:MAG TPA: hypothetical protein VHQ47_14930 [Phycisphaerae bacterium]|nr:hypothetical protein [Phycisphaerae bacterium]
MGAMDEVIAAVQGSAKIDASTKALLVPFLQAGAAAIESVAPAAIGELFASLAGTDAQGAATSLAAQMTPAQVAAGVGEASAEMKSLADERAAAASAARGALAALGQAALGVLAQAVVSAL